MRVPVFLVLLLVVRGTPALLVARAIGVRAATAVGLLQATSLPFLVTATQLGVALGKLSPVTAAAIVCAGLLSVLIFPPTALALLRGAQPVPEPPERRERHDTERGQQLITGPVGQCVQVDPAQRRRVARIWSR